MEEADGGVLVSMEEQEALNRVEDTVILEQREPDVNKNPRVKVEEACVFTEPFMARIKPVALSEHHPAAWVKACINDATATR